MLEAEKPGAVVAVSPMELTLPIASQVLRAGIPVLVEKPPGLSVREATQLVEVARDTQTPHMVSFNRRFSPAILKAKEWLAARSPSRPVRLVSARMFRHKRREENFVAHTGIHLTDTVLSFTGTAAERGGLADGDLQSRLAPLRGPAGAGRRGRGRDALRLHGGHAR